MEQDQDTRNPRSAFLEDLALVIDSWSADGRQIIVGIDLNDPIEAGRNTQYWQKRGLQNVMSRHGESPPTTLRGSKAIDAIYASPDIATQGQAGMMSWAKSCGSDGHRVLWWDIDTASLFGNRNTALRQPQIRRLQLNDPRTVEHYLTAVRLAFQERNILQRVQQLQQRFSITGPTTATIQEWEDIDNIRSNTMLQAEERCRKIKMGNIPWTAELQTVGRKLQFYNLLVRQVQAPQLNMRLLLVKSRQAGITIIQNFHQITLAWAKTAQEKAQQEYESCKKAHLHTNKRGKWLDNLARAKAESGQEDQAKILDQLNRVEHQRVQARLVRITLSDSQHNSLTSVTVPTLTGITEYTTKSDIEQACLLENAKKFTTAQDTPYPTQLNEVLGSTATNKCSGQILLGQLPETEMDPHLRAFLEGCKQEAPTFYFPIDAESHIQSWRKMKEYTATGVSRLHFGHFMANTYDTEIATIDAIMSALPFLHGFCPQRWCQGINVMLEKKPGVNLVSKLRTIVLFEPDFNHSNKRLGRLMLENAETNQALADEQYGSRVHKSAIEQCINKRLTFDIIRQAKIDAAICSNDAKGCYDRIIHGTASLAMQRVGVHPRAVQCMFGCIQQLRHYICTAYGISDAWQQITSHLPIHGVGQGNGAGPAIWAVISTIPFNFMRQQNLCATFKSPITNIELKLPGFGFVDDTELVATATQGNQLMQCFQEAVCGWASMLRATGGALEPDKSFDLVIEWIQRQGKWTLAKPNTTRTVMPDQRGTLLTLDRITTSEGRRALGVRLAADGNNRDELAHLQQRSKYWANKLLSSKMRRSITWTAFHTTIMPALTYPLAATTFTYPQANSILQPLLPAVLATGGIVRSFPRAVVHGPWQYQGLQIPHIHTEQGLAHIKTILQHSSSNSLTGILLRQSFEHLQEETGLSSPLLHHSYETFKHCVTPTWLTCVWSFAEKHNIKIMDTNLNPYKLQRHNDLFIMEGLAQILNPEALAAANICRRWLQVLYFSDIVTLQQHSISSKIIRKETARRYDRPSPKQWETWNDAIELLLATSPLMGHWHSKESTEWLLTEDNTIYHQQTQQAHSRTSDGRTRASTFNAIPSQTTHDLHFTHRIRIKHTRGLIQITEKQNLVYTQQAINNRPIEWYEQVEPKYLWIFKNHQRPLSFQTIVNALTEGTAMAVCDGSLKDGIGTAAAIITSPCLSEQLTVQVNVPQVRIECSSYRSELFGIYSVLMSTLMIERTFGITKGQITVACDNKAAVKQSNWNGEVPPFKPDADLITAIRFIKQQSNITYQFKHVKGHQSATTDNPLDVWANLNNQMDKAAKLQHQHYELDGDSIYGAPWAIYINKLKLTSNIPQSIRKHCATKDIKVYWEKKNKNQFAHIDKDCLDQTMAELPPHRRRWVTKHCTGLCGVNKQMHRWKLSPNAECPRCGAEETAKHVWECRGSDADKQWQSSMKALKEHLVTIQTDSIIIDSILQGLHRWRFGETLGMDIATEATQQQSQLGWDALLEGRIAQAWSEQQRQYLTSISSRRSSRRWTIEIGKKMVSIAWDLWAHRNGVVHQVATTEKRKSIFDTVNKVLQRQGPYQPEEQRLLLQMRHLTQAQRKELPGDYLVRWCHRLQIYNNLN
jgi:hypothetical protein